jgi:hypothetical protein
VATRDGANFALVQLKSKTATSSRPARNASKIITAAETLLKEAEEAVKNGYADLLAAQEVRDEIKRTAGEAQTDFNARFEEAKFKGGPMIQRLSGILDTLHVQVQAFFQHFIGNHCYTMLKKQAYIFSELRMVALEIGKAEQFDEFTAKAKPLWTSLFTVTRLSLKARMLTEVEITDFCDACAKYQELAYAADDSNALKRHMYTHLSELAKAKKTIGLFSETAFESIHARYNAIERRYLHIVDEIFRDQSIRAGLALQQDRDARRARGEHLTSVARGQRKTL